MESPAQVAQPGSFVPSPHVNRSEVVITDVKMPFMSMVTFMIKWMIAAIPAILIFYAIIFVFILIFGGLFAGIAGASRGW